MLPLKPRTHLHSQPKGDKRNLPHGSFLKMIIIYAIVSRHVQLKHLRRRSFLNLGWSQNIGTYRLNITGMPSDLRQRSSIFPTLEKPHRPKVPPMMRTLSINKIKHRLPKPKVISFFLPLQRYMKKYHVVLHAKEARRATSEGTAAVIKFENIEVYISFDNFIQGNGKRLSEWDRCAHFFKRQDVTKHPICHITC